MKKILLIAFLIFTINSFGQEASYRAFTGTMTGTNSYSVTVNAILSNTLLNNREVQCSTPNVNSGASTLKVNGMAAYPIVLNGAALIAGDIPANQLLAFRFNLSLLRWELQRSGSGAGTVTSVSATSPLSSTGGSTPTLTITQSGTGSNGYLSSTDWNTFNNKWGITGNSGTTAGTNFLGTTDNIDLIFKRNSVSSGRIGVTNTSFGVSALNSSTTGLDNTAVGVSALAANTTGDENISVGKESLLNNTTGDYNTAIGFRSMYTNTTGFDNTAIGWSALKLGNGHENTAIGDQALFTNSTGDRNVALGFAAGFYETGSDKLFIDNRLRSNEADGRVKALIYGVFGTTVASQSLTINGQVKINDGTGSTGYVFTKKADGFGEWQAPSTKWTAVGNDIYNNNSAGVAVGSGIAFPLASQMFINAASGRTGLEIATANSLALSLLGMQGGADIYNFSGASFGTKIYSAGDGLIVQSLGTGATVSSPGLVFRAQNVGTLSANSTDVGISFQDDRILNGKTATGNFLQITRSNAATGPLFTISNNGTDLIEATYDGKIIQNGLYQYNTNVIVADDGTIDLPAGVHGWGYIQTATSTTLDGAINFRFDGNAVVTQTNTGDALNAAVADTDTKICVFDNGTSVRIKNRLGGSRSLFIQIYHN